MLREDSARLWLLEASKVRNQHSTLMDGILLAYGQKGLANRWGKPKLFAHSSFFSQLSRASQDLVEFVNVPVMDPERRRLVRKSLLEVWVILRRLWSMPKDDILLVTSMLPSSAIIVELLKFFFPSKKLILMVHGEIEGAGKASYQRWGSFGFYVNIWFWIRKFGRPTALACIDVFIAEEILRRFSNAVAPERIFVIPHPLAPLPMVLPNKSGAIRCCFVGFNTPNKGYSVFERVAEVVPTIQFHVIGGGIDRDLTGDRRELPLKSMESYLEAIVACDIAVFPYTGGYSASLSAAALDALSCGLHLLATRRGCFVALAEALGDDCITLFDDEEELKTLLSDKSFVAGKAKLRSIRLAKIAKSRYGSLSVASAIGRLMESRGHSSLAMEKEYL
jgi:hypothetical protein